MMTDNKKPCCMVILLTDEQRRELQGKALGLITRPVHHDESFFCYPDIFFLEDFVQRKDEAITRLTKGLTELQEAMARGKGGA